MVSCCHSSRNRFVERHGGAYTKRTCGCRGNFMNASYGTKSNPLCLLRVMLLGDAGIQPGVSFMSGLASSAFARWGSPSRTKVNRPVTCVLLTLTTTSIWSSLAALADRSRLPEHFPVANSPMTQSSHRTVPSLQASRILHSAVVSTALDFKRRHDHSGRSSDGTSSDGFAISVHWHIVKIAPSLLASLCRSSPGPG